jgi:small subunit ribosomal protein S6
MVQSLGGEVLANRLWTEQKLAYPIKGHRKGTYWLTYFRLDSRKVGEFNRACQLNENILRNLVVRVEPRLVDVLVSHALGKRSTPVEAPPAPAAASAGGPGEAPEKPAEASV